jgi:RNA polymerase sigma factor (sigma-70 family)
MKRLLRQIRRAALFQAGKSLTDAELLELFLARREEAAFEALVRRHAPMVLGVCRRVLRHVQDAEDAFQATFLVLARKAASLRSRELLGHWLYRIAFRTALKARAMNAKRRGRERNSEMTGRSVSPVDQPSAELLAHLDAEINRLPEKYRVPVVLCELEGKSRKKTAAVLGLPEGTLSWRLAHARKLLARRLRTHVTLIGVLLTGGLAHDALAAAPGALIKATAAAGLATIRGDLLRAGAVSAQVLTLTEGVMKAMLLSKLKGFGAVVLALALGVGGVTYHRAQAQGGRVDNSAVRSAIRAHGIADELEALRLEVAALRKGLEVTRERVRMLEQQATESSSSSSSSGAQLTKTMTLLREVPVKARIIQGTLREVPALIQGRTSADAVSAIEAAVKVLRRNPADKQAADDLERALQFLRQKE